MYKSQYFDADTIVERVDVANVARRLAEPSTPSPYPIVRYAQVLGSLRKQSSAIGNEQQQMEFGVLVRDCLRDLAAELGLPEGHFSVDTSGDPLLVREGRGQHWIMPTNFESGAYFSTPHADHQYSLRAEELPRIRIGRYAKFGKGSGINAGGDITIGDGVWLSPGSLLLRQDHTAYGRPAVGSRTVSMTRQPGITLRDLSWVGRDALVGWNCDYIGLGTIVGTRSFVNGWVGDYSIVGDHDRILQYLPFKAFLFDRYGITVEESIRISDWEKVDQDWRAVYSRRAEHLLRHQDQSDFMDYVGKVVTAGSRVLVIKPSSLRFFPLLADTRLDVITCSRGLTPYILQWASDERNRKVRVRCDLSGTTLPFETAGTVHYNKRVGYQLVISEYDGSTAVIPLAEVERVLAQGGVAVVDVRNLLDDGAQPDTLVETGDINVHGDLFKVYQKK